VYPQFAELKPLGKGGSESSPTVWAILVCWAFPESSRLRILRQIPAQIPYISYEDSSTQKKISDIINKASPDADLQDPFRLRSVSNPFLDPSQDPFLDPSRDPEVIRRRLQRYWDFAEEEAEAMDKDKDIGDEIRQVIREYLHYTHKDDKLPLHPRR
jgi:hypothetical protein